MTVDFNAPEGERTPENETGMFAPTPLWARDTKKRRGGRAAAPRSDPAMDAGEAGAGAGVMGATTASEPADVGYETQPLAPARRGASALALALGVAAAAILAGVGWYASQRHAAGVAELTPGGAPPATQTALNAARPPDAGQLPITRVSDRAAQTDAATGEHAARRTHRTRAQVAPSAGDSASNTSAAEPMAQTPATAAGTASQTETTNLNPLAGTTSPVPPASTPSASSAEPGASPAATPSTTTTP